MTKVGEHFITRVTPTADRQAYKYYFNNSALEHGRPGPLARPEQTRSTPSSRSLRATPGATRSATTPALEDMVIYQLHVGTFAGRNDPYGTAATPARYLDVAGARRPPGGPGRERRHAEPGHRVPGRPLGRLQPEPAVGAESKYGTPDQLKYMVDRCTRTASPCCSTSSGTTLGHRQLPVELRRHADLLRHARTWRRRGAPQPDFDKARGRDYYANSALMWLEEYRLDGFRMDGTDYMNIGAQAAAGWALMQRLQRRDRNRKFGERVTIAEQLPDDSWVTRPTSSGGAGFDASTTTRSTTTCGRRSSTPPSAIPRCGRSATPSTAAGRT